jgi:glycosyltransferase involved in cell wall biosynthesis
MPARTVLLVAYAYPPVPPPGSNRWIAMCSYLERRGHEVVVLTTDAFGSGGPAHRETVRARDLSGSPTARRLLRRAPLPREGTMRAVEQHPHPVARLVVPDVQAAGWVPSAVRAGRRLLAGRRFDCVVTSSGPSSAHLVPLLLGRRRPAWVADFQDGWHFEPLLGPFPTRVQRGLDRRLERLAVESSEGITVHKRRLGEYFHDSYGVDSRWIPNAWDPDLEDEIASEGEPELRADRLTIAHTGALTTESGRDPRGLIQALLQLAQEDPETAARLELVLAGPVSPEYLELFEAHALQGMIRYVGALSRPSALGLQRRADVLLMHTGDQVGAVDGKLAEYLVAGRPIVVLGAGSESASVISDTQTGVAVDGQDPAAIAAALRQALSGELQRLYAPRGLERFSYPRAADQLVEEIERAIARRAGA